jgi:hypothetical protein
LILQERNSQGLHYNEEKSGDPFNLLGGDPRFGLSWQCELQSLWLPPTRRLSTTLQ